MATVLLRNINPLGQVDLRLVGREGEPLGEEGSGCLEPGEVFEIDAALAGRAPTGTPSWGEPGQDDFAPASKDWDPGEGLLAQVGNYELVAKAAKKGDES